MFRSILLTILAATAISASARPGYDERGRDRDHRRGHHDHDYDRGRPGRPGHPHRDNFLGSKTFYGGRPAAYYFGGAEGAGGLEFTVSGGLFVSRVIVTFRNGQSRAIPGFVGSYYNVSKAIRFNIDRNVVSVLVEGNSAYPRQNAQLTIRALR